MSLVTVKHAEELASGAAQLGIALSPAQQDKLLAYLNENCVPSAYWAGGPGWSTYRLAVEPRDGKDRPQMEILQKNLANDCKEYGPTRTQ